ncbi:hypothetical protein [Vibrio campbellii]|uniref:hypothetical protein n=1 Tax=Vibrio campbellii TaxID=680 RepID=UPI0005EF2729|nr:hypothetical protein [Vibrio campbellii]
MKFRFLREADELLSYLSVCFHHNITVIFSVIRVHDRNNFILLVTMFASRFIGLHFDTLSPVSLEVFGQSTL